MPLRVAVLVLLGLALTGLAGVSAISALAAGTPLSRTRGATAMRRPGLNSAAGALVKSGADEYTSAVAVSDPVARVANANPVVPRFHLHLVYNVVDARTLQLTAVLVHPYNGLVEGFTFNCSCSGRYKGGGSYQAHPPKPGACGTIPAPCARYALRGKILMRAGTLFAVVVYRSAYIARYVAYVVHLGPPRPIIAKSGCIGADVPAPFKGFGTGLKVFLRTLRVAVPCIAKVPSDAPITFSGPTQDSSTPPPFAVTGFASGPQWLIVYQGPVSCAADAWAQSITREPVWRWHVQGNFSVLGLTQPITRPGYYCAYLQTGNTYLGLPVGRVAWSGSFPYGSFPP